LSPSSSLPLLAKIITHPAALSLCDTENLVKTLAVIGLPVTSCSAVFLQLPTKAEKLHKEHNGSRDSLFAGETSNKVINNDTELLINKFAGKHGRNTHFFWSDSHLHTHIRSHILYLQYKNQLILYVPSLVRHQTSYVTVNLLYNVCTYCRIYQNYSSPINTYDTLEWHTIHIRLFYNGFSVLTRMQWYIILICIPVYIP